MMETANNSFQIVGQRPAPERTARLPKKWFQGKPLISIMILAAIILGCLCATREEVLEFIAKSGR